MQNNASMLIAIGLANILFPIATQGADFCTEIARRGLLDESFTSLQEATYQEGHEALCRKYTEDTSEDRGLSIGYADFTLGYDEAKGREFYENLCTARSNVAESIFSFNQTTRVLSDNAVRVVEACARRTGLIVSGQLVNPREFTISIHYIQPEGVTSYPSYNKAPIYNDSLLDCDGSLKEVKKGTRIDTKTKSLHCTVKLPGPNAGAGGKRPIAFNYPTVTIDTNAASAYVFQLPPEYQPKNCSPTVHDLVNPPRSGGLCRGCLPGYGNVLTDTLEISPTHGLRWMEFDIPGTCGDYFLEAVYGTPDTEPPRTLVFSIDGRRYSANLLRRPTPYFAARTYTVALFGLPSSPQPHVLRFERNAPFPHIVSMRLIPVASAMSDPGKKAKALATE
ncbi:MAG: hypothetical protein KIT35_03230 [Piscinibacter sp.]|uniref:hypothetical protein n=1 Tax=Piscinibacter sp. TaxID=1903157 RepID=UPI0025907DA0|nr:hypothetical protein [Piscinibacter sp.]MCW5662825.1 hypothetical protein [Piscinibacter sp.]